MARHDSKVQPADQRRIYERWAPVYDTIYERILANAQRQTVKAVTAGGSRILEVGIGTGLTLRYYPQGASVTGVDLSSHMLRKAAAKRAPVLAGLACMDAQRLAFADQSFDAVAIPFVITLVPDAEAALDEALRVVRPGGRVIVTSKMSMGDSVATRVEERLAPLARRLGLSTDFRVARLDAWAKGRADVAFEGVTPLFPAGFFKLARFVRVA